MRNTDGKTEQARVKIPLMASQEIKDELQEISEMEEQKLSTVAFWLLLRGLAAYRRDGILKEQGMEGLFIRPNYNPQHEK
ncbi:MAG TPA: hypothetical protein VF297_16050 [Pyrinomonadaceae bacterium]